IERQSAIRQTCPRRKPAEARQVVCHRGESSLAELGPQPFLRRKRHEQSSPHYNALAGSGVAVSICPLRVAIGISAPPGGGLAKLVSGNADRITEKDPLFAPPITSKRTWPIPTLAPAATVPLPER